MTPDIIFEYRRDGVEIIGYEDKLVIKKNGLTIELGYEIIVDLEQQFSAFSEQLEQENQELFKQIMERRRQQ